MQASAKILPPDYRCYDQTECAVFRKTNERFGGLSNMAPGYPLLVNGISIANSELLYQAMRFPHEPSLQELLFAQRSPMTAKMKIKPYRSESRPDWERIRTRVMRWCLRVKLAQNWETFGMLLVSTDERPIVEFSTKDPFWGAQPADKNILIGMNVLGRLLMELRFLLRQPERDSLRNVQPPEIPGALLLGNPIERVSAFQSKAEPARANLPETSPVRRVHAIQPTLPTGFDGGSSTLRTIHRRSSLARG